MIRLNELKMPLGATEEEVKKAACKTLKIKEADVKSFSLARRSIDSRKKDNIFLVYSVDIETDLNEENIVAPFPTNKAMLTENIPAGPKPTTTGRSLKLRFASGTV